MWGLDGVWLFMLVRLTALWVLVALAIRWVIGPRRRAQHTEALRVLEGRLTRGDITTEEYRRVRQLRSSDH